MDRDIDIIEDINIAVNLKTAERTIYSRCDPLEQYPDRAFRSRFRMTKESFKELLELLESDLRYDSKRGQPITGEKQLLIALRFYATNSLQQVTGDTIGVSQPTISRIVSRVSKSICRLYNQFIQFPKNENSSETMKRFYNLLNGDPNSKPFPGVIGAIDCTHVQVLAPGVDNREAFRNRKGYLSLNVQAICDADLIFTNVVVRWPGSVHDSRIFNNSEVCAKLANKEVNWWLLGDEGYGCKPYLLTPLLDPKTRPEKAYNYAHIRTRNVIERAFGVLKKRFGCLSGLLKQDLVNTLPTITACFILHNFLRQRKDLET